MLLVTATPSPVWMQTRLILCDIEAPRSHLINTELVAEDQVSGGLSPQKEREDATRGARRVGPIFVPFVRLLLAIVVGGGSEFRRPSNLPRIPTTSC